MLKLHLSVMRLSLLLLFFSFAAGLAACDCAALKMDKPLLEYFSFTAHVRITGRFEPAGPWEGQDVLDDKIVVTYEVIEHFGGDPIGWFYEEGSDSSCGLGIEVGEEWVVCAVADANGDDHTGMCLGTTHLRNADGEMNWRGSEPTGVYEALLEVCKTG